MSKAENRQQQKACFGKGVRRVGRAMVARAINHGVLLYFLNDVPAYKNESSEIHNIYKGSQAGDVCSTVNSGPALRLREGSITALLQHKRKSYRLHVLCGRGSHGSCSTHSKSEGNVSGDFFQQRQL